MKSTTASLSISNISSYHDDGDGNLSPTALNSDAVTLQNEIKAMKDKLKNYEKQPQSRSLGTTTTTSKVAGQNVVVKKSPSSYGGGKVTAVDEKEQDDGEEEEELASVQSTVRDLDARLDAALEATRRWRSTPGTATTTTTTTTTTAAPGSSIVSLVNHEHEPYNIPSTSDNNTAATQKTIKDFIQTICELVGIGWEDEGKPLDYQMYRIIEMLKTNVENNIQQNSMLSSLQAQMQRERGVLDTQIALESENKQLGEINNQLRAEIQYMSKQLAVAQMQINSINEEANEVCKRSQDNGKVVINALEGERSRLAARVVHLEKSLAQQAEESRHADRRLQALSAQVSELLAQKKDAEKRNEELGKQIKTIRNEQEQTLKALGEAQRELTRAYADADQLQTHYDEQIAQLEESLLQYTQKYTQTQKKLRETVEFRNK